MGVGTTYLRDRLSGINWMEIGIAEGVELGGETPYELAENLAMFDAYGESPLMLTVKSPRREGSVRIRYIRPENETYASMLGKMLMAYDALVRARKSGEEISLHIYLGLEPGTNKHVWLILQGFPTRVNMRVESGEVDYVVLEISLRLTVGEYGGSVVIQRV